MSNYYADSTDAWPENESTNSSLSEDQSLPVSISYGETCSKALNSLSCAVCGNTAKSKHFGIVCCFAW